MKKKIVVIDYGIGNVASVENAVNWLGYEVRISNEEKKLREADFLILPGVGAFGEGINNLINFKLKDLLDELVLVVQKPIMGICLGMQLLADSSEENGFHKGLGWIKGKVKKFEVPDEFPVPHVGWNNIDIKFKSPLFNRVPENPDFYFDHGYHYVCENPKHVLATTNYGIEVTAAINKDHIWGVQFHPEKSQNNGLKLFRGIINSV